MPYTNYFIGGKMIKNILIGSVFTILIINILLFVLAIPSNKNDAVASDRKCVVMEKFEDIGVVVGCELYPIICVVTKSGVSCAAR